MKNVSEKFKKLSKKIKQQDLKLSINNGELTVKEVHFMPINIFNATPIHRLRERKQVIAKELIYSFEGQLFKTIMQQIEIKVKNADEIKDKNVIFKYGILVDNEFEYVDMGEYYIKDVEDDKNKEELEVTGYDKMINFMKPFKQSELQLTYPCKMSKLVSKMCEICGVEIYNADFYNADLIVTEDFFTIQELTYRDVLEKIAQATLTTIFIKENKLYLCKIGKSVQTLDTSYLSNLVIEEKFGPVNALVLGRGSVEDNIEEKDQNSIDINGRCEIRFDENEFIDDKRETVIKSMFGQIKALKYYSCEASNLGLMWLEPCDVITAKGRDNKAYETIYLSARVTINTGIKGEMETKIPEVKTTEYKVTTEEEKKTLKVERLAKKNEGLIEDIIEENTETSNKLSKHEQTINSMKDTISAQETKIETVETKADKAQTTANNAISQITTTSNKITEVEKTVDGITQSVSSVEEKIETVGTKVDNLQIGTRNLALNTRNFFDMKFSGNIGGTAWTSGTKTLVEDNSVPSKIAMKAEYKSASVNIGSYLVASKTIGSLDKLKQNEIYTFSFWAKASEEIQLIMGNLVEGQTIISRNSDGKIGTEWKRIVITFKYTNTSKFTTCFYISKPTNDGTIWLSSYMLEKGNMSSDWTPAPEDIETNLQTNYYTKSETNTVIEQKNNEVAIRVNELEDVTNTVEGTKAINLGNCVKGSLLELHIYGNNDVFSSIYPANSLYPSDSLYPKGDSRIIVTNGEETKIYELGVEETLRSKRKC